MEAIDEAPALNLEDRLDRRKGRPARDKMTGVRFTQTEMAEVDRCCKRPGTAIRGMGAGGAFTRSPQLSRRCAFH